jgi:uncharacterized membrane protein YczE
MKFWTMEIRLRLAGSLMFLGLIVEFVAFKWSHPTAFVFCLGVGTTFVALGVFVYLSTLLCEAVTPGLSRGTSSNQPVTQGSSNGQ